MSGQETKRGASRRRAAAALAGLALALASCAGTRVASEQHVEDLDAFATYAWSPELVASGAPVGAALGPAIRRQVDRALAARGLRPAPPEEADLLVRDEVRVETRLVEKDPYYAVFFTVERHEHGALTLALLDPATGATLWRATGERRLRVASKGYGMFHLEWLETNEERDWSLPELVDAIFGRFPRRSAAADAPAAERAAS